MVTRMEARLLAYMTRHAGHVCTRTDLLRHVWGWDDPAFVYTRTVDVTICRLRQHLPAGASIVTLRGIGYRYVRQRIEPGVSST